MMSRLKLPIAMISTALLLAACGIRPGQLAPPSAVENGKLKSESKTVEGKDFPHDYPRQVSGVTTEEKINP